MTQNDLIVMVHLFMVDNLNGQLKPRFLKKWTIIHPYYIILQFALQYKCNVYPTEPC